MKEYHRTIVCLVAYNGSLQLAHWCADTKSNEHRTLGKLYEIMLELVDDYAEVCMGKHGLIDKSAIGTDCCLTVLTNPPEEGLELVVKLRGSLTAGEDDDLLNILADMSAALNRAKYLLKSKSLGNTLMIKLSNEEPYENEDDEAAETEEEQAIEKEEGIEQHPPVTKKKKKSFDIEGME